jgi:hypothetical protein
MPWLSNRALFLAKRYTSGSSDGKTVSMRWRVQISSIRRMYASSAAVFSGCRRPASQSSAKWGTSYEASMNLEYGSMPRKPVVTTDSPPSVMTIRLASSRSPKAMR